MSGAPSRRWRVMIPLSARIFAINLLSLIMLAGGVLYLDTFRTRLLEQRRAELTTQAGLFAAAIEALDDRPGPPAPAVSPRLRRLIETATEGERWFVQLYHADASLALDSRYLDAERARAAARVQTLNLGRRIALMLDDLIDWAGAFPELEPYDPAARPPGVATALAGRWSSVMRRSAEGQVVVIVAAPLPPAAGGHGGAIVLTSETRDIRKIVRAERQALFNIFLMVLAATLLLSIFQARTIVRPIRRLARAADRVRLGRAREVAVPRFARRRDEIGRLARAVSDMTHTLHVRMDAIEAFAADVAHELKNPLSSLRSAVDSLPKTRDPELQRQLLAIVRDDVARIDRLITDISDASRLDAELSRARMDRFDLLALLRTLVEVRASAKGGGSRGRGKAAGPAADRREPDRPAPAAPAIMLDADGVTAAPVVGLELRMGQVFRNLLDNALSFSPPGGTVTIGARVHDGRVVVTVDDDGPGIPAENLTDIFRRFYSQRPEAEDFGQHSGLGLAIARQIVEAHGGHLHAENRITDTGTESPDAARILGARFTVDLPLAG